MKVLIIDDNVAIQEIIKDVLLEDGHLVRSAGSISEGVRKTIQFEPEAIFIGFTVGGVRGTSFFNEPEIKQYLDGKRQMNVIIVRTPMEKVDENPNIIGQLVKPFTSDDIRKMMEEATDSVRKFVLDQNKKHTSRTKPQKNKNGFFSRFHKKEQVPHEEMRSDVELGKSYIFFEDEPKDLYRFIAMFVNQPFSVLVVTSDKVKAIKERFSYGENLEVISMSYGVKNDSVDIRSLGTLVVKLRDFIRTRENPVVFIDNVNDMIETDGFNDTLRMIHYLMHSDMDVCKSFAISVDARGMSEKERNIFLHDMTEYQITE